MSADPRRSLQVRPLRIAAMLAAPLLLSACNSDSPYAFDNVDLERRLGATDLQQRQLAPDEQTAEPDEPRHADTSDPTVDDEGRMEVSVEQAVLAALRYNRSLSIEQLDPVLAGTFEALERAMFDPRVFGEASYSSDEGVQVSPALPEALGIESEASSLSAGIAQRLATGTEFEVELSHEYTDTNLTDSQQEVRGGVSLTQALLQGFGRDANLVDLRQASIDTQISEYELRGFAESLVAEVEDTYWNYSFARRQVAIFEHSLELARQQLEDAESRVEIGVLPRTELAASRAEVARRQQELIAAQNRAGRLRIELLRLMNLPADDAGWEADVIVPDESPPVQRPLDEVEDHVALGLRLRPEINEARLRLDRQSLELVRTRNGLLPRLDLFVTLGKTGYAGSFGDAVGNLDESTHDFLAGIRAEYPLGNRGPEAAYRAANITRYQAALALENLAQLIESDIRSAYLDVVSTAERITATAATRALQEEVLRAETEKFQAGASTSFLVAQAQRDLLAAEIEEVGAAIEYRLSLVNLYRVDGSLLERRAIQAPGRSPASLPAP